MSDYLATYPENYWLANYWADGYLLHRPLPAHLIFKSTTVDGAATLVGETDGTTEEYVVTGSADSEAWYQVKAQSCCGVVDDDPRRQVRVAFDGDSALILPVPNAPVGLKLTQDADGVTAEWMYVTNGQGIVPATFNVYVNVNDAGFDYDTPTTTVTYASRQSFSADLGDSFSNGDTVEVVVRSEGASGSGDEEPNTNSVTITVDKVAPTAAATWSVTVTAE